MKQSNTIKYPVTFSDIFKLPLHNAGGNVRDFYNKHAFQFVNMTKEEQRLILAIINGEKTFKNIEGNYYHAGGAIFTKDKDIEVIRFRGWHWLSDTLPYFSNGTFAEHKQHMIADFVINQLNNQ